MFERAKRHFASSHLVVLLVLILYPFSLSDVVVYLFVLLLLLHPLLLFLFLLLLRDLASDRSSFARTHGQSSKEFSNRKHRSRPSPVARARKPETTAARRTKGREKDGYDR